MSEPCVTRGRTPTEPSAAAVGPARRETAVIRPAQRQATDPARMHFEEGRLTAVLVDDHELVLEGLQRALARDAIDVVGAFLDGDGALEFLAGEMAAHTRLDLVVVDLRLGGPSCFCVVDLLVAVMRTLKKHRLALGARNFNLEGDIS